MRYWAVDDKILEKESKMISLESGLQVSIKESDALVFFMRKKGTLWFYSQGIVESSETKKNDDGTFSFNAQVTSWKEFEDELALEDFTFTLRKIYRYLTPNLHFRRRYLELRRNDFKALIEGSIYWSRTGFGIFVNQLPHAQMTKFFKRLVDSNPEFFFEGAGYKKAWAELKKFINEEYGAASSILTAIKNSIQEIEDNLSIGIKFEKIGLSSDESNAISDELMPQEQYFSDFSNSLATSDLHATIFDMVDSKIEESSSLEDSFDEEFRGVPWPIVMIGN